MSFGRNGVSLNIAGGTGANGEYYDEVCAMSQETINENFKVLFKQRGADLTELWYKDVAGKYAVLDAILDPPQVKLQIGASEAPEFYFEIHFKSGNITFDANNTVPLAGWVITVRSQLATTQVTPKASNTKDQAAAAESQLAELKKSYDISKIEQALKEAPKTTSTPDKTPVELRPGDYSIERLYCLVAEGQWSTPVESHSFLPHPKDPSKKISLKDWKSSSLDASSRLMAMKTSDVLGNWARENQESSFWNLGIQVRLPVDKVTAELNVATCAPTAVRLQNYPYANSPEQLERVKQQQTDPNYPSLSGELGHPQNCLMFCEVVRFPGVKDRPLPTGSRLAYNGNLAEPASGSKPGIPGTFVLDHRAYLEKKILVHLRELCVATSVIPLWPNCFVASNGEQQFQSRYVVGANPQSKDDYPGLPDQNASNAIFNFGLSGPGRYVWEKTYPAPGSGTEIKTYENCNDAPVYRKWTIEAKNKVEVTWNPGDDNMLVKGSVAYDHWEAYNSRNSSFGWKSGSGCYYGAFAMQVSWSFNIDLCVKEKTFEQKKQAMKDALKAADPAQAIKLLQNGIIQPTIQGLDSNGLPTNLKVTGSGGDYVRDKTDKLMRDQVEATLKKGIAKVSANLLAAVNANGRFIYPGTRTLVFGDPKLNNFGDVVATVDYVDLDEGLVTVITPGMKPIAGSKSDKKDPVVTDSTVTGKSAHVTWSTTLTHDPLTKKLKLVLRGSNAGTAPAAFEDISVQFLATTGVGYLFKEGYSQFANKADIEEEDRKERQRKEAEKLTKPTPTSTPTPAPASGTAPAEGAVKTKGSSSNGSTSTVPNGPAVNPAPAATPVSNTPAPANGGVPAQSTTKDGSSAPKSAAPKDPAANSAPAANNPWADLDVGGDGKNTTVNKPADNKPADKNTTVNKPADNKPADNKPAVNKGADDKGGNDKGVPLPKATYDLGQKLIEEKLRITFGDTNPDALIFRINPDPNALVKPMKVPRFTIPPEGYFNLTVEGELRAIGDYAIQLDETWNAVNYNEKMSGKRQATTFLKASIEQGTAMVGETSQASADKLRGVVAKPAPA